MGAHVGLEVEVQGEESATDMALVGSLACVHQLVSPQLAIVQELLAAAWDLADEELFAVGELVFLEETHVVEGLAALTDLALKDL